MSELLCRNVDKCEGTGHGKWGANVDDVAPSLQMASNASNVVEQKPKIQIYSTPSNEVIPFWKVNVVKMIHRAIAELTFEGIFMECMIWEESAVVTASVNVVEMINPLNEHAIILVKKVESEEHFHEVRKPSLNIHTYIPKANSEGELYILSSRARTMWDISLINVKITIPWENGMSEMHRLVLGLTAVTFTSKRDIGCFAPDINVPSQFVRNLIDIDSSSELLKGLQVQDLHDHFEIKIIDFEINLFGPIYPYTFPILRRKLDTCSLKKLVLLEN
ncbi:hypothetical protein Tco_0300329 [Tanacetum coccineum]